VILYSKLSGIIQYADRICFAVMQLKHNLYTSVLRDSEEHFIFLKNS